MHHVRRTLVGSGIATAAFSIGCGARSSLLIGTGGTSSNSSSATLATASASSTSGTGGAACSAPVWSHAYGDGNFYPPRVALASDASGSLIFAGGSAGQDLLSVPDPQGYGTFVGKWNPDGTVAWVRVYQSPGYSGSGPGAYDRVGAVTADETGAVYFTKFYSKPDGNEMLVAKLDPNGTELWRRTYTSTNANGTPFTLTVASDAIAIDAQHHVVVGGRFVGAVDFGGATLDSTPSVPLPPMSPPVVYAGKVFALALTTDGQFVWSTALGQIANPDSANVQPSLDGVVIAADQVQPDASYSLELVRLSGSGAVVASRPLSGALTPNALTRDPNDHLIVAGDASGKIDLGLGAVDLGLAGFVAAYGSDFSPLWEDMLPNGSVSGLSADPKGDLAFFLNATGMTSFGGQPLDAGSESCCLAGGGTFIGKLDAAGNRLSIQRVANTQQRGLAVATPNADFFAGRSDGGALNFTGTSLALPNYFDFVASVCP